ncbi:hypothetical protein [Nocardiopsis sp. LOL_012]|uniref:hypothetical protein n=1 Tax=Nocardiopsis sp. LOL_012 TaxID=3345409 RepID=UPI003A838E8B
MGKGMDRRPVHRSGGGPGKRPGAAGKGPAVPGGKPGTSGKASDRAAGAPREQRAGAGWSRVDRVQSAPPGRRPRRGRRKRGPGRPDDEHYHGDHYYDGGYGFRPRRTHTWFVVAVLAVVVLVPAALVAWFLL